jgi:hypothetical protein
MPKYEITYEKNKVKVIRASNIDIARVRAEKGEGNGWVIAIITEQDKE